MVADLMLLAIAIWVPGTVLMVIHLRLAPVGIEDENGFRPIHAQPVNHMAEVIEYQSHSRAP